MSLYRSIFQTVLGKALLFIVQFALLAVYSRLFSPEEFGILALAQVILVFFQVVSINVVTPALINADDISVENRDGIFSVTFLMGVGAGIFLFIVASTAGSHFYERNLTSIAALVSLAVALSCFTIVPITSLIKDLKFKQIAFVDIVAELISFVGVLVFYSFGLGLIALASRFVFHGLTRYTLLRFFSRGSNSGFAEFGSKISAISTILSFSTYQFAFNFVNYFSRNLDNLLVGKYFGVASLGLYDRAYRLMMYPLQLTTMAMSPAIQAVVKKQKNDLAAMAETHNALATRLLFVGLTAGTAVHLNAEVIVHVVLGSQWGGVSPLLKGLALIIPIQVVLSSSGAFFQAAGQPKYLFYSGFASALVNVTAIISGVVSESLVVMIFYLLIAFAINFYQAYIVLYGFVFKQPVITYLKSMSGRAVVWGVMWYVVDVLLESDVTKNMYLVQLALIIVISIYGALFHRADFKKIYNKVHASIDDLKLRGFR